VALVDQGREAPIRAASPFGSDVGEEVVPIFASEMQGQDAR
jgi:hypothetical protein